MSERVDSALPPCPECGGEMKPAMKRPIESRIIGRARQVGETITSARCTVCRETYPVEEAGGVTRLKKRGTR